MKIGIAAETVEVFLAVDQVAVVRVDGDGPREVFEGVALIVGQRPVAGEVVVDDRFVRLSGLRDLQGFDRQVDAGAGQQQVIWDGRDNNGTTMPAGDYKISITAKDASGQTVAVSTEVEGVVDGIDVTKSPPLLSIGAQTFTIDQVKSVRRS